MPRFKRTLLAIFLLAPFVMNAQSQHSHPNLLQSSDKIKSRPIHKGRVFETAGNTYFVVVKADGLNSIREEDRKEGQRTRLSSESLDEIWELLSQEIPNENFAIVSGKYTMTGNIRLNVKIEGVGKNFKVDSSDFLISLKPYTHWTGGMSFEPELGAYVDFDRWNRDTGYAAAKDFLTSKRRFIEVTLLVDTLLDNYNQPDMDAYKEVISKTGLGASAATRMIVLENGNRAKATAVDLKRLEAIYQEPRIINIIPNLGPY